MKKILKIDIKEHMRKSIGSFGDIYSKFAILQNRLAEKTEFSEKERKKLLADYTVFRNDVARRVESCRQMLYKSYKYDAWYQEIKAFYEELPCWLVFYDC